MCVNRVTGLLVRSPFECVRYTHAARAALAPNRRRLLVRRRQTTVKYRRTVAASPSIDGIERRSRGKERERKRRRVRRACCHEARLSSDSEEEKERPREIDRYVFIFVCAKKLFT